MHRLHQDPRRRNGAPADGYSGGGGRASGDDKPQKVPARLRYRRPARWRGKTRSTVLAKPGRARSPRAGGIVFYGDDRGELAAADAVTGKKLWSFPFTDSLHTSPMTYMFDNKQYVAMLVGSQVFVFGLAE